MKKQLLSVVKQFKYHHQKFDFILLLIEIMDLYLQKIDLVAQLVEHLPFKERVLGSSPSQVTKPVHSGFFLHPGGGIGRHAVLRGLCFLSVWVQIPFWVQVFD